MKILYLNNYHYVRGGSERVFFGEMDLMKKYGHEVGGFSRQHPLDVPSAYSAFFPPNITTDTMSISWDALRTLKDIIYSMSARKSLDQLINHFEPNIAHAHNIYGRLTTSTLDLLSQKEIPMVMTLHDYKLMCPSYLFMHQGNVCEACKGSKYHMAILKRCHKSSYTASAIVAFETYLCEILNKYKKNISVFLSPSKFLLDKLIEYGWPDRKIEYVPNFIDATDVVPNFLPGTYFFYLGRLSEEKGIATLINAYKALSSKRIGLIIAGEGPLRSALEKLVGREAQIEFSGYLSGKRLQEHISNSLAVVVPSLCYENAPLSILESLAYGKPVIGANIGGIPEMIEDGINGFLFSPGDVADLHKVLHKTMSLSADQIVNMGRMGREKVEKEYAPEKHYQQMMNVYLKAMNREYR